MFILKELEINLQLPTFCPKCQKHSMNEVDRREDTVLFKCSTDGCTYQRSYEEKTNRSNMSENAKRDREEHIQRIKRLNMTKNYNSD